MGCELDVNEVKEIANRIFDHILNDLKISKVVLRDEQDFYWEVPSNERHAVNGPPPQLDVGRLTDDWDFLKPLLKDKDQAVSLMLIHLAPLLRYLGEKVGQ